jgi:hypothetical protein
VARHAQVSVPQVVHKVEQKVGLARRQRKGRGGGRGADEGGRDQGEREEAAPRHTRLEHDVVKGLKKVLGEIKMSSFFRYFCFGTRLIVICHLF